jgi:protein Tex
MNEVHIQKIAAELKVQPRQVLSTARLFAEGATVPFIARYRKEATGSLDEVAVTAIRERLLSLAELDQRREAILKSLAERNLLTDELKAAVNKADNLNALEDVFQPYRPKRRTRAMVAKEQGLEPLADLLFSQQSTADPQTAAATFVSAEKGVADVAAALAGARDIIAERVSDDANARSKLRDFFWREGTVKSKVMSDKKDKEEGAKFKDYFDWTEPVAKIPSHRLLAVRRGETEGILMMRISVPDDSALAMLEPMFATGRGPAADQVRLAVQDGYKRLLSPAIEVEMRLESKKRADAEAIRVFAENLRELLLASPLGRKNVLAIDPGFRTGCKIVCLDRQGKLLHNDVIYPTASSTAELREAAEAILSMVKKYQIEAIAIGNGTAGRETETFVKMLKLTIPVIMVNESGASIYSASEVAREEFPNHDVTVRGAVSIGRRLTDPLAELVKLDPKSIGVGQYQHDVDQPALKRSLDDVVISCVNGVGVEINTASKQLLAYVSGLGPALAANIVNYRNENGPFKSRAELKKVPRLGEKAYEQAAGFLRIRDGEQPLDASAVHPERYELVDRMAKDLNCSLNDLMRDAGLRQKIQLPKYVTETVGLPTLNDILSELAKPGRDPRQKFEVFSFQNGVEKMEDLKLGMKLPGIVTNVTAFGAFVDIGVHQDGLVHVSQLADRFVKDPSEVVKVAQKVTVTVTEIDLPRKRIALSMKSAPQIGPSTTGARTSPGAPRPQDGGDRRSGQPGKAAPVDWFTAALNKNQNR